MSSIVIKGNTSGQVEIAAPDVAGSTTLTLPTNTGNIVTTGDSATVTQGMIGSGVAGAGQAAWTRTRLRLRFRRRLTL